MVILCLPLADHGHPVGVLLFLDLGEHGVEDVGGIAGDGKVHIHVLAQLAGVNVDLNDRCVLCKGLGVQSHTVREASAHRDEDITIRHRPVGGVAAVHSHHTDVHGVAIGHNACRHQGVGSGDLRLVDEVAQGLAGGRRADTAAKVNQRPLCRVDEVRRPLDLLCIKSGHRADGLRLFGGKLADRRSHVLGDIHQHGTLAAALCNAERGPHGVGQVFHPAHREIVLGNGHRNALNVSFLEAVLAQTAGDNVARKGHHGYGIHVGRGNAGDQVGSTRAAGGQHHTGAARCAGVAIRCMGRALLVGCQHMGDSVGVLIQFIVKVEHRAAGIAKDGIHALLTKDLYKNL